MRSSMFTRIKRKLFLLALGKKAYFVEGLGKDKNKLRALLYYKTEPFIFPNDVIEYSHTNLWEIREIVNILNSLGFVVDVIDRSRNDFLPEDKYDLFLGLGSGASGKYFSKYASIMHRAIKVLLATGPMPNESNRLVQHQYDLFNIRHGSKVTAMRLYSDLKFNSFVEHIDYVFSIGESDQLCHQTYESIGKPVFNYFPSGSPEIYFNFYWMKTRSKIKFLCFAGNGFICKGVDLVVEAFLDMPELELYVCGPDTEKGFFEVLGKRIEESKNIHYEGFVKVGGKRFNELIADCSYVIFASSSEGCATSVTTVMRAGLVPILSPEVGINIGDFGFKLSGPREDLITEIRKVALNASKISEKEYRRRVLNCLKDSMKYTQASFTQSFTASILRVLEEQILA